MKAGLTEIAPTSKTRMVSYFSRQLVQISYDILSRCISPRLHDSLCSTSSCWNATICRRWKMMKGRHAGCMKWYTFKQQQVFATIQLCSACDLCHFVCFCSCSCLFFWVPPLLQLVNLYIYVHMFRIAKGHWVQWSTRSLELQVVAGPLAPASTVGNTWPVWPEETWLRQYQSAADETFAQSAICVPTAYWSGGKLYHWLHAFFPSSIALGDAFACRFVRKPTYANVGGKRVTSKI